MKKILALFVVITSLFSLFTISAYAQENDSLTDFNFATTLGFIDGESFLDDDVITRIQLAEIFYNIVFPNQKDSSDFWDENDFPDVPAEKKHIASAVYGLGVMRGYSDNTFAPDDEVTYNQLVKSMVSFLGYDLQAQRIGGYPSGYLTQASILKILPSGNVPGDSKATFGAVASMLKKAIGVNFATLDGDGTQMILKGEDYLYHYRNIRVSRGTVTCNYLTNILGGETTTYFGVYFNDVYMDVADTAHGLQNMLGHDVYVFYEDINNTKTAVYYEKGLDNVLEIESGDIAFVSGRNILYYSDNSDTPLEAQYAFNATLVYNGSYCGSYIESDLNPFASGDVDGSIKLIDSDFDSVYDIIVVTAFNTYVVRDIKNNKIYGYYEISNDLKDKVIDVSNYKERNIDIRNILGEPLVLEAVKSGYVINVCRDKSGTIKEIIVSRDSTTGVLQEVEKTGDKITKIKLNDVEFPVSGAMKKIDSASRLSPGVSVKVYFNCEDKVAYIDVDSAFSDGFLAGYLVDAGKENGLAGKVKTIIFTAAGEMKEFDLPERIKVNGVMKNGDEFLSQVGFEGKRTKRQAVLYKTDDNDNLNEILFADIPENTQGFTDGFYQFPDRADEVYAQVLETFGSYFALSENVVTFAVPNEKERDDYEKYSVGATISDNLPLSRVKAYGTSKSGIEANVLVVSSGDAGKTLEYDAPIFVITKISTVADEYKKEKYKIFGHYVEGTTYSNGSFVISEEDLKAGCNGEMPKLGDVLRTAHFSETGECGFVTRIFKFEEKKFYASSLSSAGNPTDTRIKGGHRMMFGTVYEKSGNMIKVNVEGIDRQEVHNLTGGYYKIIECKKDKEGNYSIGQLSSSSCVIDERFHPGEGSKVLIYSRSGTGIAIFVFN